MKNVIEVKTGSVLLNSIANKLYPCDIESVEFLSTIKKKGIVEPLIVREIYNNPNYQYEVISGNRRLRAAIKLNLDFVPVHIVEVAIVDEGLIVVHNQQRVKSSSSIIKELVILREVFGLKQGRKSKTDKKLQKGKELKANLIKNHNRSTIDRLSKIDKLIDKLADGNSKVRESELKKLDKGSVNGTLVRLQKQVDNLDNQKMVGDKYEVHTPGCDIYQKSSDNMSEVKDNSVACIITSPPYFDIRDYNLGEGELGHESSAEFFVNRLAKHFNESKRVLKKDGTLWVNLGDYIQGHGYSAVPEKFLIGMLNEGWILHDKIIWVKNNPVFTTANRSVLANEFIYVFKKNPFVNYNTEWAEDYDEMGFITIGGKKIKSVFNFRDNVIQTNSANNSDLRKECKEKGFTLTHDATFPISIPSIAIMTASNKGDLILDPFSGTGTTGRSAQLLGRNYVGYDLNPTFIKQSEIRLNMSVESDLRQAA